MVLFWLLFWLLLFIILFCSLAYQCASLSVYALGLGVYLLAYTFLGHMGVSGLIFYWAVYGITFTVLLIPPLRRLCLTAPVFKIYCRLMPKMSDTEKEALYAGNVGWTREIFSGRPDWFSFEKMPLGKLTKEESAFLAGPVEELCAMCNDWEINQSLQIPERIWKFIKQHKFFGMIIPRQYDGLGFSATAQSAILCKLSSVSTAVSIIVCVPNSLGPAELLLEYGTDEQKNYYLPRLANGKEIPCFALTSPSAGSDAASMTDSGVVCRAEFAGKEQLCLRLNWNKRYITLSPVATILGLAFKLYDPDHLLGDKDYIGITCALIPTDTAGVVIGRRHIPLACAFPNGPTQGKDVIIPIDWIIGGAKYAGQGWRMLMECLAAGRGVSIPSVAAGGAVKHALASSAYARIRRQFNVPIGRFGGVQEALVEVVGYSYLAQALRLFTAAIIDQGIKPVVASAITKYNVSEYARKIINSAMDLQAGKGICMGPNNYLAQNYFETPIAITVEGANILTRSMIIYGQGAIRCHPYLLKEIYAGQDPDQKKGLLEFDKAIWSHLGFIISNHVRSLLLGITRARFVRAPQSDLKRYYQLLTRYSTVLAMVSDVAMVSLGAALKRKENLSGRLADLVSLLYMIAAVLKYYESGLDGNAISEELPTVKWLCHDLFKKFQHTLNELLANLPNRVVAAYLRVLCFPFGRSLKSPADSFAEEVSEEVLKPSVVRDRFKQYMAGINNEESVIYNIESVFKQVIQFQSLESKVIKAMKANKIKGMTYEDLLQDAKQQDIISEQEMLDLKQMDAARMSVINVDDFAADQL